MTAQGGDLLAWLDAAIAHRESEARAACHSGQGRWTAGHRGSSYAVSDETGDVVVYNEGAPSEAQTDHIALNDPESVLRRCAADRKLIDELRDLSMLREAPGHPIGPVERMALEGIRAALRLLAEGYGWTEGER